ncbi:MAG: peptidylprolyl isomerase [Phycisphaerales bacterium]|nr:MAG: peptidylprolyl isomerase [Phycisphaerales bacterium]
MSKEIVIAACCLLFPLISDAGAQQPPPASTPPAAPPASPAESPASPVQESVAVTVNGHAITEDEVSGLFEQIVRRQTGGRPIPEEMLRDTRVRLRPQLLEILIDNRLLDEDAERAGLKITDQDATGEMEKSLQTYLLRSGMTRSEFEEQLKGQSQTTLQEFVAERAAEAEFRQSLLHAELLASKYPKEVLVQDEEISQRYERDLERIYSKPAMVRASHILFGVDGTATQEEKLAAKTKAEEVLKEARAPEADFAALARDRSSCPSSAQGGDLGFFPKEGAMVEPFADAAFALQKGEISNVVETRFGFHIIKVTDRKEATVITPEQAKDSIRLELRAEKIDGLRSRHVEELKKSAKIVYTQSKEQTPEKTEGAPEKEQQASEKKEQAPGKKEGTPEKKEQAPQNKEEAPDSK